MNGFGMNVIAYDPFIQSADEYIQLKSTVDELLQESDFVSLHMPYSTKLHHFIDKAKLEK
ncbi:hypothetical protein KP78_04980 [Jeotgalibacillus soli]|uniref:D-isomer specific 2-hydroxyacid dehydrogenase NAD-binding domain-containing protein n=1 Tax=Jeotgalibacillus soli TaxID=889306 RepID=A0A0C2W7X8_9BACL|nr:hypothetical protein KP78_04980 [Jeotgalibacillus soli]